MLGVYCVARRVTEKFHFHEIVVHILIGLVFLRLNDCVVHYILVFLLLLVCG